MADQISMVEAAKRIAESLGVEVEEVKIEWKDPTDFIRIIKAIHHPHTFAYVSFFFFTKEPKKHACSRI
mgnify:CR=1 FL=1